MIHFKSFKQKLNTIFLTKSEVVGTSNYLPFTIWCKHFIESQGCLVKRTILTKIIRVVLGWRKLGRRLVGNKLGISISDTFYEG